jgi:hypothetical protein
LALVLRFTAPFLARFFSFRACFSTMISSQLESDCTHAVIVCTESNNVQELANLSCGCRAADLLPAAGKIRVRCETNRPEHDPDKPRPRTRSEGRTPILRKVRAPPKCQSVNCSNLKRFRSSR